MTSIGEKPGDPEKGKLVFISCLACHKVGDEGQEIAIVGVRRSVLSSKISVE
jgi:cytochrome c2